MEDLLDQICSLKAENRSEFPPSHEELVLLKTAESKLGDLERLNTHPRPGDDLHTFPRPYQTSGDNRKQFNAANVEFGGEKSC